ncbi:MAG: tetratricopeptide repeat protein [Candidatus Wallbacteria bacterium]|nr:tetratricopeptide repeat protein [Candidatus Wallbacteria bacterium]
MKTEFFSALLFLAISSPYFTIEKNTREVLIENAGWSAESQYKLGLECFTGSAGVPQDYKQAMQWFLKAAIQGHSGAQFKCAVMYENGYGVQEDSGQAALWYEKAAEQSITAAQYAIGLMYYEGSGVEIDMVKAYFWLNLAAATGYKDSVLNRDILEDNLTPDQLKAAGRMAQDWKEKHPGK